MAEDLKIPGQFILHKAFSGGYVENNRVGIQVAEFLNPLSVGDRQKVFYSGVASLGKDSYANYWADGSPMSMLKSEFGLAFTTVKLQNVNAPNKQQIYDQVDLLNLAYEERITAYMSLMGLSSAIQHCDGTMATVTSIMPQEHELSRGWDRQKAEMVANDPAIRFPLDWIRDHAEDGYLLAVLKKSKDDNTIMKRFLGYMRDEMNQSAEWAQVKAQNNITDGVEDDLVFIALNYWIVEDLPEFHRNVVATGATGLTYQEIPGGPTVQDNIMAYGGGSDSKLGGYLPFDDVWYGTIDNPAGILRFKGAYPQIPDVVNAIENALLFWGVSFTGEIKNKSPSQVDIKALKRYGGMWDALIGGSQGGMIADMKKFGEGVEKLCNLYNTPKYTGLDVNGNQVVLERADIVGAMVGELMYAKVLAAVSRQFPSTRFEKASDLLALVSSGINDNIELSKEVEGLKQFFLGSGGDLNDGFIQEMSTRWGLKMGTEHFWEVVTMLQTGSTNAEKSKLRMVFNRVMQPVRAVGKLFGSSGGKKR